MKTLIFIEDFNKRVNIPKGDIITLNVKSHYDLFKNGIDHLTISDVIDFDSYLIHEESYNNYQKSFFEYCDNDYKNYFINGKMKFSPYRIIGFEIKTVLDSLFSQALIIYEIIKKIKPQKVYLISSRRSKNEQVNYFACSKGNYYDYLFNEIIEYFSSTAGYSYEIIYSPVSMSSSIETLKVRLKNSIRNTKYFNFYRQSSFTKNPDNFDKDYFKSIVGSKNLFMNHGWGLKNLFQYSLLMNKETMLLINNHIFVYSGSVMSKYFPIIINDVIENKISSSRISKQVSHFDNFVNNSIGISLYNLIHKRITFFNDKVFPTLYFGCEVVSKVLKEFDIDKVIGNMRMPIKENFSTNVITHILPFMSTNDDNCDCLYFTHGYDPYILDRTFLELPCNIYYTHNEEYKEYFTSSFKNQNLYAQPKTKIFKL